MIGRSFLIPGRQPSELLEAIDESFYPIALPVNELVEWTFATHVTLLGNSEADASTTQKAANGLATIPLVACDAFGAYLRSARTQPLDRAMGHERFEGGRFVALAGGQAQRHRLTMPLGSQVHLGAEAAATPP